MIGTDHWRRHHLIMSFVLADRRVAIIALESCAAAFASKGVSIVSHFALAAMIAQRFLEPWVGAHVN